MKTRFGKKDNGAVGIGTLIVFIAMVLVAAIAAAVLINTSGELQDRASKTGAEATKDVSGGIKVQHMEGYVNVTGEVTDIRIYIALHAGTSGINIVKELELHLTWVDQESTGASSGTVDLVEANNSASVFNDDLGIVEEYSAAAVVDPHGSFVNNNVLDQDSVVLLNISCDEIERSPLVAAAAFGANGGLAASSSGSVKFIISSGMTPTIKGFNVPGSFPANGGWVKFY